MRILTVRSTPVKPTRHTRRPSGRFGAGILATHPVHTRDHTAADEAWLIADNASRSDRLTLAMLEDEPTRRRVVDYLASL